MRFRPWLVLFRAPNLATAAGDAMAGGACFVFAAATGLSGTPSGAVWHFVRAVLCAAASELFFYMAGLADNDLVDETSDRASGKRRPLVNGDLSRRSVRIARAVCLALAAWFGRIAEQPVLWWVVAAALTATILGYNRAKERFTRLGEILMGLCRGFGVLLGCAAAIGALPSVGDRDFNAQDGLLFSFCFAFLLFLATTLLVRSITRIGAGEEFASHALPFRRYFPAAIPFLPVLLPISLLLQFAFAKVPGTHFRNYGPLLAPVALAAVSAVSWVLAVRPLGQPHGPAERGKAVGRTIGALLWMQSSMLVFGLIGIRTPLVAFPLYAVLCHAARFLLRRIPAS